MPVHVLVWLSYCNGPVCPERAQDEFQTSSDVEEGAFQYCMFNSGAVISVQDDAMPAKSASDPTWIRPPRWTRRIWTATWPRPSSTRGWAFRTRRATCMTAPIIRGCAHRLLLRANGYDCTGGIAYHVASKRRVEVPLDSLNAKTP